MYSIRYVAALRELVLGLLIRFNRRLNLILIFLRKLSLISRKRTKIVCDINNVMVTLTRFESSWVRPPGKGVCGGSGAVVWPFRTVILIIIHCLDPNH